MRAVVVYKNGRADLKLACGRSRNAAKAGETARLRLCGFFVGVAPPKQGWRDLRLSLRRHDNR
jgi:hypothetical protein